MDLAINCYANASLTPTQMIGNLIQDKCLRVEKKHGLDIEDAHFALQIESTFIQKYVATLEVARMTVWPRKFDFKLSVFLSLHDYVKVHLTEQDVIVNAGKQSLTLLPNMYFEYYHMIIRMSNQVTLMICKEYGSERYRSLMKPLSRASTISTSSIWCHDQKQMQTRLFVLQCKWETVGDMPQRQIINVFIVISQQFIISLIPCYNCINRKR